MRTLLHGALAATLLSIALLASPAAGQTNTNAPVDPALRFVVHDARRPVQLTSADMRIEVIGHAVQTRVELVFLNPNDRVLEGELQFPLRDGQQVTGFELDIDGQLRAAVPVEKARGQQVFEDVTRARVDPALLELTLGQNYKLRVYPLPPRGTRRVVLHIAQQLGSSNRLEQALPLALGSTRPALSLQLRVAGARAEDIAIEAPGLPPDAFTREASKDGWAQLSLARTDFASAHLLTMVLPAHAHSAAATQTVDGQTYFYAELPVKAQSASRAAPRRIALLWDASGSGAQREHGREFALLDAYFAALGQAEVLLRVGREVAEPVQRFIVRDGRWDELRQTLARLPYDGASNLSALTAPPGSDLALLFSDGLSNWGASAFAPGKVPLYSVSAAVSLDVPRLRAMAERSGGEWLDLDHLSITDALRSLQTRKARLLRMYSNAAHDLVAAPPFASGESLAVAGILSEAQADIVLEFERPDGSVDRQHAPVGPRCDGGQVAQRWAGLRIAELEPDFENRRAEIRRLGKRFGLVTRETSLIVLDAVADYVRFEIEPPDALRPEYERQVAQQGQRVKQSLANHLDGVAARFAEQVAWWERAFPKDDVLPREHEENDKQAVAFGDRAYDAVARAPAPSSSLAEPASRRARQQPESTRAASEKSKGEDVDSAAPAPASIRLTPWQPDAPYARRLREAAPEDVYRRYLDERPDFVHSTAFFLDAADVLFAKGKSGLALRVLSNLAEMDLENRQLLRVLGYRLLQARQPALAIPVFRCVQRLGPDEPQSYRDLGLALAEAGQWQAAVDELWQVVSRPWDARFPDIDMTALAELNAIVARAARSGQPVHTETIDPRLLRNLPLDLRITLTWDADNTDIDLWVTDPNGEKAYYGHRLSRQGGHVSHDVTGGYGPEEFALHVAKPGRYVVQAQFYGHRQQIVSPATTLMLRLSTGFGRADQKDEMVTLRLAGPADMVTVGTFEVGR